MKKNDVKIGGVYTAKVTDKVVPVRIDAVKGRLGILSNVLILHIVFFAISKAASNPLFVQNLGRMHLPLLYLAFSQILMVFLAYGGARILRLDRESTITVLFAAPQKTMALGIPLLTTYFAQDPRLLGSALLPLLFYHPWQLLVAGFVKSSPLIKKTSL